MGGVAELIDAHFLPHGNWQGLSPGKVLTGWLSHILSEADRRLNQVQAWAAKRSHTLQSSLDVQVHELDFSDERLAIGLDLLREDEEWAQFERSLNQRGLCCRGVCASTVPRSVVTERSRRRDCFNLGIAKTTVRICRRLKWWRVWTRWGCR